MPDDFKREEINPALHILLCLWLVVIDYLQ